MSKLEYYENMLVLIYKSKILAKAKLDILQKIFNIPSDAVVYLTCCGEHQEGFAKINYALSGYEVLSARERFVIIKRYGLECEGRYTLDAIAEMLQLSKSTISRAEASALRKIKQLLYSEIKLEPKFFKNERQIIQAPDFQEISKETTLKDMINQDKYHKEEKKHAKIEIEDLLLKPLYTDALKRYGCRTLQDLIEIYLEHGAKGFADIPYCGHTSVNNILIAMKKYVNLEELDKMRSQIEIE